MTQSAEKVWADLLPCGFDFALRDPSSAAAKIHAIQLFHPCSECEVAALTNIGDDIRGDALGFPIALVPRTKKFLFDGGSKFQYSHQSTILFRGYSTMPWALAAFSFGKICRTTASSTMVLMATQSGSLSAEMVGFLRAGKTPRTAARSSRCTLRSNPTLLAAAIAPCSMSMRFSAFSRFHGSAAAARFMMNTVADSSTVSTMRRRLARREEPVSVTSTMASAS